jgi:hypothetical protein
MQCVDVYWPVILTLWYGLYITTDLLACCFLKFSLRQAGSIEQETA